MLLEDTDVALLNSLCHRFEYQHSTYTVYVYPSFSDFSHTVHVPVPYPKSFCYPNAIPYPTQHYNILCCCMCRVKDLQREYYGRN